MSKEHKNLYEGMYIISATLSDDARQKALDKIVNEITAKGGVVHKIHDQGRRRLAYEINGYREGHYYVIYFDVPTPAVAELWQEYHLNEDLIRFVTLRAEKVLEKIEFKTLEEVQ
jgi:small subunit ribosomal protein S6